MVPYDALVLLGCKVKRGELPAPARRRVARAAEAFREGLAPRVVVSGGRVWEGELEADRLATELVAQGVPRTAILLERASLRTRENARFTAELVAPLGWRRLAVVTCDFHAARAAYCFRRVGLDVELVTAPSPKASLPRRFRRFLREQGAWIVDRVGGALVVTVALTAGLGACNGKPSRADGAASSASASDPIVALASNKRALALLSVEQRRASRDVEPGDLTSRDEPTRRAAARALARIADARAAELLLPSLADQDPEVLAWTAFGLGSTCAGREQDHVRALVLRATSLELRPERVPAFGANPRLLDPVSSIADALARCGGSEAERTLRAWLGSPAAEAAAWALGTLATRSDRLEDATQVALLDAASRHEGAVPGALQAFTRLGRLDEAVQGRLFDVARAALARSGSDRTLAIRALGATGERGAAPLGELIASAKATPAERGDAARALGRLGASGQVELSRALVRMLDEPRTTSAENLGGAGFGVLKALLAALTPPPDRAGPALSRLANLPVTGSPELARRVVALRCAAASLLAGRGTESAVLAACDPDPKGRAGRLARLAVLDRGPLRGARLRQWQALAEADDTLVRERALELLAAHAEAPSAAAVTRALAAKTGGEVATAAQLLAKHPERASARPGEGPAPDVNRALGAALEGWEKSPNIEVRATLVDAAASLGLLAHKPRFEAACASDNPTLRAHVETALHLLGDRARHCDVFEPPRAPPAELLRVPAAPVHLDVETNTGTLGLELDPTLAPVATTRLVELARSHFFDGVGVHRVVPGFVVQLGDRDGDGYGGADLPPLRCETSPARFEAGSVGIALSGRDTGSSQFFVTLGREAHLDGEYALVGRAGPGWDRVAEGDVVKTIRVK